MLDQPRNTQIDGITGPVFRRDHIKADGRHLSLYGLTPHNGSVLDELLRKDNLPAEIRHDPLRNSWAVYAPHRQTRTFMPSATDDPLAPARIDAPATEIPFDHFELAIFENRFPSFSIMTDAVPHGRWASGIARGHCDVVVYTEAPDGGLHTISQARRVLLVEALIDRYHALHSAGLAYVLPFENRGEQVGVTLPHPHGQIYAFQDIPVPQANALNAFRNGYDLVADHASWKQVFDVAEKGGLTAFCPPFARFPYETWIMPTRRCPGPWALLPEEVDALASLLGEIPRRLDKLFGTPMPYMMSSQAAPRQADAEFQFTVQFYPMLRSAGRQKFLASVEQFTGVFTVDVLPEAAAERLRAL